LPIRIIKYLIGAGAACMGVIKMLSLLSEGYVNKFAIETEMDIEKMAREFNGYLVLLKSNFYKED